MCALRRMSGNASIADIEMELEELDELICLQRRKVDLLKTKNSLLDMKCVTPNIDSAESDSKSMDKHSSDVKEESLIRSPLVNIDSERETKLEVASSDVDDRKTLTCISRLFGTGNQAATATPKNKEDNFIDSMTRLQRLTTDLANERNLLAWGRTALAASRTCLAFFAVSFYNLHCSILYPVYGIDS